MKLGIKKMEEKALTFKNFLILWLGYGIMMPIMKAATVLVIILYTVSAKNRGMKLGTKKEKEKALGLKDLPWLLGCWTMFYIVKLVAALCTGLLLDISPFWLSHILFELRKWNWI